METSRALKLLLPFLLFASITTHAQFHQDRFAISFFIVPQTSDNMRERYREIADANFNVVLGSYGNTIPEQLALCREFNLRAIVQPTGPVESYPKDEACWGYILQDEPSVADFPRLAKSVAEIREKQPGRFGYINLFPNYANAQQLGVATYEEHVARYMREVKPDVLCMDHYPLMRPNSDGRAAYLSNLEVMRRHALEANIPFWNFFYSMPFNDRLDPTEAQLRWQIFASVAYGAKGVLYFCYWTPGKGAAGAGEFPKGGAILTAEGLKTRHYDEARRINAELKSYGPTLMQLTSLGAFRFTTAGETRAVLTNTPIRNITRVGADPANEFIIGSFKHADGRRAVLILNHNYSFTAWAQIEFDADPTQVLEVSKLDGKTAPVIDDSPELKGLQLSFGPGDARLFLLPR